MNHGVQKNLKIGICGAHGTGKTTLARLITEQTKLPFIEGTLNTMWAEFGVQNFELLPLDVRTLFQKYVISRQVEFEDKHQNFVTDRTVIDMLGYTLLSSDMSAIDVNLYKLLVISRLKNYSHLIYVPIMFDVADGEKLRAKLETRHQFDQILQSFFSENPIPNLYTITKSEPQSRLHEVLDIIQASGI